MARPHKSPKRLSAEDCRPEVWVERVLGEPLYPPQRSILADLLPLNARVYARCGNEVGKTRKIICGAILWHLSMFPHGQVISTAGAYRQISDQLIPALKMLKHKFPSDWDFQKDSIVIDGIPRYIGFAPRDEGTAQGWHAGNPMTEPLLAIIDEGAAVPDYVYLAFEERCRPTRMLITGSPLGPEGTFYRIATDNDFGAHYKRHKITQLDCPHIPKDAIDRRVAKYGASHPIVLSSVFAEFAEAIEGALLSMKDVADCLENAPEAKGDERHCFCDFAAGGDENTIGMRVGNRVWLEAAWREKDSAKALGKFLLHLRRLENEWGLRPEESEGDASGMGIVFINDLRAAGWNMGEFYSQSPPVEEWRCANRITENWVLGARKVQRHEVQLLRLDEDTRAQLVTRKLGPNRGDRIAIESKKELLKRHPSPDRAEVLLGAMMPPPFMGAPQLAQVWDQFGQYGQGDESDGHTDLLRKLGAHVGA